MADNTAIEWADATLNLAWGCTKVSPGCKNCYAERLSKYTSFNFHFLNFANQIKKLQSWEKPRLIFVNSMSDTFHEQISDDILDVWFDTFRTHNKHTYIVLTKRINRAYKYFKTNHRTVPYNVWLGTSVENKNYLHRIDKLKKISASTRFVSFEPLLGPMGKVDLEDIHWVIVGGESDYKNPRPMDSAWAEEIRLQCEAKKIPFFFKQMGGTNKAVDGSWGRRTLYGKTYQQFPKFPEPTDTTKQITLEEAV